MSGETRSSDRLTMGQVCKVLRVSRALVRQWETSGKLQPIERTGKGVRLYDVDQVVAIREARVEAQLRSTTRTVEPQDYEVTARREALTAALAIVKHAAELKAVAEDGALKPPEYLEGIAQCWGAAAKCLQAIVDASKVVTTVKKTTTLSASATTGTAPWFTGGGEAA